MAWIESHQSLAGHLKLRRLARELRIHRAQAIGHLHLLWWWALDGAPTGDLSALSFAELADVADWPGDAHAFVAALKSCGWLDPDGRLHDWQDYGGRLVQKRVQNRQRQERWRQNNRDDPGGVTRDERVMSRVTNAATLHNSREQKKTVEREQYLSPPESSGSEGLGAPGGAPEAPEVAEVEARALGAAPGFGAKIWHLAASRGWRDAKGLPIRSWPSYLAACHAFHREAGPPSRTRSTSLTSPTVDSKREFDVPDL